MIFFLLDLNAVGYCFLHFEEIIKYKKDMFICFCPHLCRLRTATLASSETFATGIRAK